MAIHNDFGKEAEKVAADYLSNNRYTILHRNFRHQKAEIDIIAENSQYIVIVEVKARSTTTVMLPETAVNKKKIRFLISAANHFLETNQITKEVRFDIISLVPSITGNWEITHLENAFESLDIL